MDLQNNPVSFPICPLPKPDKGFRLFLRRLRQAQMVWSSKSLRSNDDMVAAMVSRYGSAGELEYYSKWAAAGLVPCEKDVMAQILRTDLAPRSALVVGCGTGREAFALERLGLQVTGVDLCPQMIEAARTIAESNSSSARFVLRDPSDDGFIEKFDFILVSGSLGNHIQGRANRVRFWKQVAGNLKPGGTMAHGPEIKKLPRGGRFYFASVLLRIRWSGRPQWEPGDTALSFLGNHNATHEIIFYHYYQSEREFLSELEEAGFRPRQLVSPPMWLFSLQAAG